MLLALRQLPAAVINLDRSQERWVRCLRVMGEFLDPGRISRVTGVDGRDFLGPPGSTEGDAWHGATRRKLQNEGALGQLDILDPVRTALCLSHQRVLHQALERIGNAAPDTPRGWHLVFEDDVRPGGALAGLEPNDLALEVPDDAEVLFLHDRVWRRGASPTSENWRIVRGGIGLEAYAVTPVGARKMLAAFRPVIEECDIQLMTFMEGYADLEHKRELHRELRANGQTAQPTIRAYAPVRPFFQTDHWLPSVKFATMAEADRIARAGGKLPVEPREAAVYWLYGRSGAGKTTLAKLLADELRGRGVPVMLIDGDDLRSGVCSGLGFGQAARDENHRRAAQVATLAARSRITVIAATMAPQHSQRAIVAETVGTALHWIHIDAPLGECARRDPKGLYRRARDGELDRLLDFPFDPPTGAQRHLHLNTGCVSVAESLRRLRSYVAEVTGNLAG